MGLARASNRADHPAASPLGAPRRAVAKSNGPSTGSGTVTCRAAAEGARARGDGATRAQKLPRADPFPFPFPFPFPAMGGRERERERERERVDHCRLCDRPGAPRRWPIPGRRRSPRSNAAMRSSSRPGPGSVPPSWHRRLGDARSCSAAGGERPIDATRTLWPNHPLDCPSRRGAARDRVVVHAREWVAHRSGAARRPRCPRCPRCLRCLRHHRRHRRHRRHRFPRAPRGQAYGCCSSRTAPATPCCSSS